ncbi:MAG: caspase family protein [Spirochaetales bacterium]|nr:caspase family protein [Spirochaetales bacterium]
MKPAIAAFLILCIASFTASSGDTSTPGLRINTEMHTSTVHKIDRDAAGKYLLSCSSDKTARLWDAAGGALIRVFRPPIAPGNEGKLYACALSPDGSTAVTGGWTGKNVAGEYCLYVFNTATGEMTGRIGGLDHVVFDCEFSPDGAWLSVCLGGGKGIAVVSAETWKISRILENYGEAGYNACFSKDMRLASVCDDGTIRLYDDSYRLIARREGAGREPYGIDFSPDGARCAIGYVGLKKLEVLSSESLAPLYEPPAGGLSQGSDLSCVCWSADGTFLAAGGRHRTDEGRYWRYPVRMYKNGGKGAYEDYPVCRNTIFDLKPLPGNSVAYCSGFPEIGRIGCDGKPYFHREAEIPDFGNYQSRYLRFSPDASTVSFKPQGPATFTFSIGMRELRRETSSFPLAVTDREGLAVTHWLDDVSPCINGKKCGFLVKNERSRSAAVSKDGKRCVLGTSQHLYCADEKGTLLWKAPLPDHGWAVNIADEKKICVVACGNGTLQWYGLDSGNLLLTLFVHGDGKRWILFSPSGYYDCSAGAQDLIGWHVENGIDRAADFFPAGRFSSRFYRPDVIPFLLEEKNETESLKAADGIAVEAADGIAGGKTAKKEIFEILPPVVSIVKPAPFTETAEKSVSLVVSVRTPSNQPVTQLKILRGGRPYETKNLKNFIAPEGKEIPLSCELVPGPNDITVCARNAFGWSEPVCISITKTGTSGHDSLMPKLYLLSVGVSAYEDPQLRLGFAAKDAADFSKAMAVQKKRLYGEVTVTLLTDEKATKDNILDGLDWIQKETTSRDIAMIFFAGHGINDNTGNLYYLPVEADLQKIKRTCLPSNDIATTIQSIAGKVVYFMDTCHSGLISVTGRRGILHLDTNKEVMELIHAENGAVVFCSSSGNQYSLENEGWGNGAFTLALVEGISGKADYIGEGTITINQLDLYISERVKKLTGGRQTPVTAKPDTIRDFPIALAGK